MQFLVQVQPVPNEPEILSRDEALAGYAWLRDRETEGVLSTILAYVKDDGTPITGGIMFAFVEDRPALDALMAQYPMIHTITWTADGVGELAVGWDVLLASISAHNRVNA
jgi:hypothetical protein